MAYKEDLTIANVTARLKARSLAILDAIDAGYDESLKLTDAQDGATVLAWSRILYQTGDTGNTTLTVDSAAKTISCLAGAGLFANFRVGRNIQTTNFTNAGNNVTELITAKASDDQITLGDATGLVNETDTNARGQENTTADEQVVVTAVTTVRDRFDQLKDAIDNVAVATADRRADLQDWIW